MLAIKNLAKSRIKFNKNRTLLTAIAIMLTTALLMGIGTSAIGLLDSNRQQAAAESNIHATFKNLTAEQAAILKNHTEIEAVKTQEIFATVEAEDFSGYLAFTKDTKEGIKHGLGNLSEGNYPVKADEICGPPAFFERLGVEPAIGNKLTISFRPNGKGLIQTKEFTICGLLSQADISKLNISESRLSYGAYISEELLKSYIPEDKRSIIAEIRVYGENDLNYDEIIEKIDDVAADIGCAEKDIVYNKQYLITMTDPGTEIAGIVLGLALLVVIFSALAIYSIYYVGVITDIQEIGKLKALGANNKQIKKMLLREGMYVAAGAIPLGLIIGYTIPYFALPAVLNKVAETTPMAFHIEKIQMFSWQILLAVIVVILLTVWISLLKPMRIAAKISPVEAIRYQEAGHKGKLRKGKKAITLFGLSKANLTGNKRRTAVTMLAMGLGCVLFMSLAGTMNSMDAADIAARNIEQGDFRLALDYSANDKEYPENNLDSLQQENIFGSELIDQIEAIDGVEKITRESTLLMSSDFPCQLFAEGNRSSLSAFTEADADKFQKDVKRGSIDYSQMTKENGVIVTTDYFFDDYGLKIGDEIPLTIYDGNREIQLNVKIAATIDSGFDALFLLPQEVYDQLNLQFDDTTDLYITVNQKNYDTVKSALQSIVKDSTVLQLYSMDEEMELGEKSVGIIKYPMYVILVMIAVIGFMNLINTMITSIVTRKHELGVLQAIGLSDRQLVKMLSGEGMVFTAGTLIVSVTLGNIFGYLVFIWAKANHFMSLSAYHFPLGETIALAAVLILGQLIITKFISNRVKKQSLIDRIRSNE